MAQLGILYKDTLMSYNPNVKGNQADVVAKGTGDSILNDSGTSLIKATPVRIDPNGNIASVNVSVEIQALSVVGVAIENILDGTIGQILTNGRIEDIVTTSNNGDVLYISKTGGLTNVQPNEGVGGFVAGDFIIRIGVIYKNTSNPSKQDLLLNIDVVGQI